jgi:hypothetical protein
MKDTEYNNMLRSTTVRKDTGDYLTTKNVSVSTSALDTYNIIKYYIILHYIINLNNI